MKYLLRKELVLFFSSASGYVVLSLWFLILSSMLWVFAGDYNIPDSGYASLRPFFSLVPVLFLFFIPALMMRSFAEERRSGTMELLCFRPLRRSTIVLSKFLAYFFLMGGALLLTFVYAFCVNRMSVSGMDWGEVAGGYVGAFCLMSVFISVGLFVSSMTSSHLVAFLGSAFLACLLLFGPDLLGTFFSGDGEMHNWVRRLGMDSHYRSLVQGVIDTRDIVYFLTLCLAFLFLTNGSLGWAKGRRLLPSMLVVFGVLLLLNGVSSVLYVRMDLTADKRHTLTLQTKRLVNGLDAPLEIVLYLNGKLNPGFDRLRTSLIEMLEELAPYAEEGIRLHEVNPSDAKDAEERRQNYLRMEERGMKGVSINERDREGKISSKVVFPWMELVYKNDTMPVNLLRRNISRTSQEMLQASVGELEYGFSDALRVLTLEHPERIAFIEGHGEWTEPYVYEAEELLSKYYHVDRGMLGKDPDELSPYKVLIVASPKLAFTEEEKFQLDQYLMQGGSLFFLLDGVRISEEEFAATGESSTLKNETNLDDLLFTYGIRVNPVVVQDMNCVPIRLVASNDGTRDSYVTLPWYFAPLLEPSATHPVTCNLSPLKSELASTVSWVGEDDGLRKTVLLTTSSHAHTLPVPEMVSLRYVEMPVSESYFTDANLAVAGLVEGVFPSAFRNRSSFGGQHQSFRKESSPARVLVCASASLIKNDWKGLGGQSVPLPLGYEPVSGEQLGNADFIVNAVNYLAGNGQWLDLRSRESRLRLLDRQEAGAGRLKWQVTNMLFPVTVLLAGGGLLFWRRRRCYACSGRFFD